MFGKVFRLLLKPAPLQSAKLVGWRAPPRRHPFNRSELERLDAGV
jgi:hypothetical protein